MAEIHYFPVSQPRVSRQNTVLKPAPEDQPAPSSERYCVYNQTRERFVATNVDIVDSATDIVEERLRTLGPGGGAALWIVPFQEISPSSVRFPIDLVFLTNECVVLNTVEAFPLASASTWGAQCAGTLALPADSLAQGEILTGDQLVVAAPDEMKRFLQRFKESRSNSQGTVGSVLLKDANVFPETGIQPEEQEEIAAGFSDPAPIPDVSEFIRPNQPYSAVFVPQRRETSAPVVAPSAPALKPSAQASQWKKPPAPKNWFMKLLVGDAPDPRATARESVSGLVAYFFTGGAPKETPVRDISPSGIFIVTDERWYMGTVIRMTLTDNHNPTYTSSMTVNAKVVRYTNDGVGLEFILVGDDRRHGISFELVDQTNGVDRSQVMEFIQCLKSNRISNEIGIENRG